MDNGGKKFVSSLKHIALRLMSSEVETESLEKSKGADVIYTFPRMYPHLEQHWVVGVGEGVGRGHAEEQDAAPLSVMFRI